MMKGQLLPGGVVHPALIQSFSAVPREMFVPEKLQEIAYLDDTLCLGQGRSLVFPLAQARLLQAAAPQSEDVVLDIASASGYTPAILSPLVMTVIALDHNKRQMDKAGRVWNKLELCNIVQIEEQDLIKGYPLKESYTLITILYSVTHVPDTILNQLSPEGRLVCFLREANSFSGYGALFYKNAEGLVSFKKLFDAYVPYLDDFSFSAPFNF